MELQDMHTAYPYTERLLNYYGKIRGKRHLSRKLEKYANPMRTDSTSAAAQVADVIGKLGGTEEMWEVMAQELLNTVHPITAQLWSKREELIAKRGDIQPGNISLPAESPLLIKRFKASREIVKASNKTLRLYRRSSAFLDNLTKKKLRRGVPTTRDLVLMVQVLKALEYDYILKKEYCINLIAQVLIMIGMERGEVYDQSEKACTRALRGLSSFLKAIRHSIIRCVELESQHPDFITLTKP